jgi:hypothetical protein
MLRRRGNDSVAAGGWVRETPASIGKSKKIGDGELTSLLVAQQARPVAEVEKAAFDALLRMQASLGKATGAVIVAYSIGLLTLSDMLSGLSASGMQIDRNAFGHVSLLLIGITSLWWAATHAKVSYVTTWFGWRLKNADAGDRAVMLLRFPEAFPLFSFFAAVRGYPRYVYPERSEYYQIASVILVLVAIIIFAAGAMAINVALAVEVWRTDHPTSATAKLTVAGAIVLSLLALAVPRFNDFKIRYHHYGLTELLGSMPPDRQEAAHRRLAAVTARQGDSHVTVT